MEGEACRQPAGPLYASDEKRSKTEWGYDYPRGGIAAVAVHYAE